MKKTLKLSLGILVMTVGILVFSCKSGTTKEESKAGTPSEQMAETTYTCSMHPEVRKSEPGNCPECGMELVKADSTMNKMDDEKMQE